MSHPNSSLRIAMILISTAFTFNVLAQLLTTWYQDQGLGNGVTVSVTAGDDTVKGSASSDTPNKALVDAAKVLNIISFLAALIGWVYVLRYVYKMHTQSSPSM